jgi:extradiol dioxygenase family protein
MNLAQFHLSIGCDNVSASADFFEHVTKAKVTHRDPSGYVNVDFYGCQITLQSGGAGKDMGSHFHFGANLSLEKFEELTKHILSVAPENVLDEVETWDKGTKMERRKIYLKCPSGYTIELKGYPLV